MKPVYKTPTQFFYMFIIGGLNNGWNLIMENITCGDGNHEWYIEFITSGKATSDKFNISQVITITTSDIFQYFLLAIIYYLIIHQSHE